MKTQLKVARVLTWWNLIFWGIFVFLGLLGTLVTLNLASFASAFLMSSIPLHAYAALQLYKSIRQPALKLASQTPVGIRFVGFAAQFFGILFFFEGCAMIGSAATLLQPLRDYFGEVKGFHPSMITLSTIRGGGVIILLLGATVIVNVQLNRRLLRWYYLVHQSDVS